MVNSILKGLISDNSTQWTNFSLQRVEFKKNLYEVKLTKNNFIYYNTHSNWRKLEKYFELSIDSIAETIHDLRAQANDGQSLGTPIMMIDYEYD